MQLVLSVFALTVATLTLALAARRLAHAASAFVYARYVAIGGLVAFTVERVDDDYHVRFEVCGPAVFHNVALGLVDAALVEPPEPRHTMSASDDPIEWTVQVPETGGAWVMVTWVRPYLEGIEPEALAQRLGSDQLYEWRWYTEPTRFFRTACRNVARRYPSLSNPSMRDAPLYGRWRRTTSTSPADMLGPADQPPPFAR